MTTTEAAKFLGLAESTVRRLVRDGKLQAEKVGPIHWIDGRSCRALKAERKRNPPRPGNPNWRRR